MNETERFLSALAGSETANFTFQTFDDNKRKDRLLSRIMHGTFAEHASELARLNKAGAGVFVTVNETDLKGRRKENVKGIRAIFVDLDGSPLDPVLAYENKPHIIIESSPGRWHAYWLVSGMELGAFEPNQRALAEMFDGDPKVHDLPRVMRLPGFLHQKDEPFLTRIEELREGDRYQSAALAKGIDEKKQAPRTGRGDANRLNDMALDNLEAWVPELFPEAKIRNGTYRISSQALGRDLQEDLSISPQGIKDFGVHDMGDKKEGARTPIDIVKERFGGTFTDAMRWLSKRVGFGGVQLEDFWAYMPQHTYIYAPTGEPWPAVSVNSRLPPVLLFNRDGTALMELDKKGEPTDKQRKIAPSLWLDRNKPVEQMTWVPGEDIAIKDKLIADGGWINRVGTTCFNQYRSPTIKHGSASGAAKWVDHVMRVYPQEGRHIISYLAHRVQHPAVKPNHALVLGGEPGIGKDTLLEPAKQAVGPWNFSEITPQAMLGRFNGFVKSVILRISEARDLEVNRYQFYEHMKVYTASPPDVLRCDEKHLREHSVINCCGVIITTNYKTDGIYLPANDRRHFVAWSDLQRDSFDDEYWNDMWGWYRNGEGFGHIAAYLSDLDLSAWDPKAPPPKTDAFWDIVNANNAPEDAEMSYIIEELKNPEAVTLDMIASQADDEFRTWIRDRKNRRAIPHRFEKCDYTPVRNEVSQDGLWKINGRRQAIYVLKRLDGRQRALAVAALMGEKALEPREGHEENMSPDIPF